MTKKSFLLKQTDDKREQLEVMAIEVKQSMTAFVQSLLDEAWAKYQARRAYAAAEAQVTKAPPIMARVLETIELTESDLRPNCACDGNCEGCKDAEGACGKAPATGGGDGG